MTQGWLMSELDGLLRLQNELDRVLEQPFGWFASSTFGRGAFPPVNIFRGEQGYVVRVEVPGLPAEDLNVDTKGDTLCWSSSGTSGFKGSRKSTPFAGQMAAQQAAEKAIKFDGDRISRASYEGKVPGHEA